MSPDLIELPVEVLRGLAPGEVVLAPGTPVGTRVHVVEAP